MYVQKHFINVQTYENNKLSKMSFIVTGILKKIKEEKFINKTLKQYLEIKIN